PRSFQADTGYAQQQDVHMGETTVREALIFSALLRQPAETPKQEKLDYVEAVIQMLEMESFANAMVGEVGAGLSVEQRKRLTIGVELAAKPELLLFLDEPTSGLDGQSAWSIIQSPMATQLQHDLEGIAKESSAREVRPEDEKRGSRQYAVGTMTQLRLVIGRQLTFQHRNVTYMGAKIGLNLLAGLFIGSSFWAQGQNLSVASLQNKLFAVFMALVISTSLAQQLQPVIINLRSLYEVRERPSKMYSWPVAVTAYLIGEVPWNLIGSTLFWAPWFWMIRFPGGQRAAFNWGLVQIFSLYWSTFATALAVISPNP
ncbi:unnamed protein product, partial [Tilletia caries]